MAHPACMFLPHVQHYRRSLLTVNEVGGNQPNKNILCNLAAVTGNTTAFAFSAASGLSNLTVQAIQCVCFARARVASLQARHALGPSRAHTFPTSSGSFSCLYHLGARFVE